MDSKTNSEKKRKEKASTVNSLHKIPGHLPQLPSLSFSLNDSIISKSSYLRKLTDLPTKKHTHLLTNGDKNEDELVSWMKSITVEAKNSLLATQTEEKQMIRELQSERERLNQHVQVNDSEFEKLGQLLASAKRNKDTSSAQSESSFVEEGEQTPIVDQSQWQDEEVPELEEDDEFKEPENEASDLGSDLEIIEVDDGPSSEDNEDEQESSDGSRSDQELEYESSENENDLKDNPLESSTSTHLEYDDSEVAYALTSLLNESAEYAEPSEKIARIQSEEPEESETNDDSNAHFPELADSTVGQTQIQPFNSQIHHDSQEEESPFVEYEALETQDLEEEEEQGHEKEEEEKEEEEIQEMQGLQEQGNEQSEEEDEDQDMQSDLSEDKDDIPEANYRYSSSSSYGFMQPRAETSQSIVNVSSPHENTHSENNTSDESSSPSHDTNCFTANNNTTEYLTHQKEDEETTTQVDTDLNILDSTNIQGIAEFMINMNQELLNQSEPRGKVEEDKIDSESDAGKENSQEYGSNSESANKPSATDKEPPSTIVQQRPTMFDSSNDSETEDEVAPSVFVPSVLEMLNSSLKAHNEQPALFHLSLEPESNKVESTSTQESKSNADIGDAFRNLDGAVTVEAEIDQSMGEMEDIEPAHFVEDLKATSSPIDQEGSNLDSLSSQPSAENSYSEANASFVLEGESSNDSNKSESPAQHLHISPADNPEGRNSTDRYEELLKSQAEIENKSPHEMCEVSKSTTIDHPVSDEDEKLTPIIDSNIDNLPTLPASSPNAEDMESSDEQVATNVHSFSSSEFHTANALADATADHSLTLQNENYQQDFEESVKHQELQNIEYQGYQELEEYEELDQPEIQPNVNDNCFTVRDQHYKNEHSKHEQVAPTLQNNLQSKGAEDAHIKEASEEKQDLQTTAQQLEDTNSHFSEDFNGEPLISEMRDISSTQTFTNVNLKSLQPDSVADEKDELPLDIGVSKVKSVLRSLQSVEQIIEEAVEYDLFPFDEDENVRLDENNETKTEPEKVETTSGANNEEDIVLTIASIARNSDRSPSSCEEEDTAFESAIYQNESFSEAQNEELVTAANSDGLGPLYHQPGNIPGEFAENITIDRKSEEDGAVSDEPDKREEENDSSDSESLEITSVASNQGFLMAKQSSAEDKEQKDALAFSVASREGSDINDSQFDASVSKIDDTNKNSKFNETSADETVHSDSTFGRDTEAFKNELSQGNSIFSRLREVPEKLFTVLKSVDVSDAVLDNSEEPLMQVSVDQTKSGIEEGEDALETPVQSDEEDEVVSAAIALTSDVIPNSNPGSSNESSSNGVVGDKNSNEIPPDSMNELAASSESEPGSESNIQTKPESKEEIDLQDLQHSSITDSVQPPNVEERVNYEESALFPTKGANSLDQTIESASSPRKHKLEEMSERPKLKVLKSLFTQLFKRDSPKQEPPEPVSVASNDTKESIQNDYKTETLVVKTEETEIFSPISEDDDQSLRSTNTTLESDPATNMAETDHMNDINQNTEETSEDSGERRSRSRSRKPLYVSTSNSRPNQRIPSTSRVTRSSAKPPAERTRSKSPVLCSPYSPDTRRVSGRLLQTNAASKQSPVESSNDGWSSPNNPNKLSTAHHPRPEKEKEEQSISAGEISTVSEEKSEPFDNFELLVAKKSKASSPRSLKKESKGKEQAEYQVTPVTSPKVQLSSPKITTPGLGSPDHSYMRTRSGKFIGANTVEELQEAHNEEVFQNNLISEIASGKIHISKVLTDISKEMLYETADDEKKHLEADKALFGGDLNTLRPTQDLAQEPESEKNQALIHGTDSVGGSKIPKGRISKKATPKRQSETLKMRGRGDEMIRARGALLMYGDANRL
ncbi:hypothetical protein LJB42_004458 [Komagataella kurtzmanii]|nr:hypothetical protein LJB42_004458 [Komagataella kurtzmanii]